MSDFYCDQVINGQLKVSKLYESDHVLAFHHTRPYFEWHIVIIPKQHIESLTCIEAVDSKLSVEFLKAINHVASLIEKEVGGCRVSSNIGNYQSSKHLHWYVHAGNRLRDEDGALIET